MFPTLSYLSAYPLYDRIFSFVLTVASLLLLVFHLYAWVTMHRYASRWDSWAMLGSGLFAAVALPSLAIFDELNSSSLIYLEKVHLLLVGAVLSLKGIWLVHSVWLLGLRRWRSNRKPD